MKTIFVIAMTIALAACGTVGGAISGAGRDITAAGEWVQTKMEK